MHQDLTEIHEHMRSLGFSKCSHIQIGTQITIAWTTSGGLNFQSYKQHMLLRFDQSQNC